MSVQALSFRNESESNVWSGMQPDDYDSVHYEGDSGRYMEPLLDAELNAADRLIRELSSFAPDSDLPTPPKAARKPAGVTMVECGFGTGRFFSRFLNDPHLQYIVGVDINRSFIELCSSRFLRRTAGGAHVRKNSIGRAAPSRPSFELTVELLEGDATKLEATLREQTDRPGCQSVLDPTRPTILACVWNTLGIMPEEVRVAVLAEMLALCHSGGPQRVFLVFFDGNGFQDAMREFYGRHPRYFGQLKAGEDYSQDRYLFHPRGGLQATGGSGATYISQWWTKAEIEKLIDAAAAMLPSDDNHVVVENVVTVPKKGYVYTLSRKPMS